MTFEQATVAALVLLTLIAVHLNVQVLRLRHSNRKLSQRVAQLERWRKGGSVTVTSTGGGGGGGTGTFKVTGGQGSNGKPPGIQVFEHGPGGGTRQLWPKPEDTEPPANT